MSSITVTFPDGSQKAFDKGTRGIDIVSSISEGLARNTYAMKCDGKVTDILDPLTSDTTVTFLTWKDDEGKEVLRHSGAHLFAQALLRKYPSAKIAIGPPIENGFHYDFALEHKITPEDLRAIEDEMKVIMKEKLSIQKKEITRDEAQKLFADNHFKIELINDVPDEKIRVYEQGEFIDFCRGPHVSNTGMIKAFKLTKVSGAYWKGSAQNEQLQRVYGVVFPDKKEMNEYLTQLEEAQKRDHKVIGQSLGLFCLDEQVGPGLILWKPKGAIVRTLLEEFLRQELVKRGYEIVYTPHIGKVDLYKTSGHYPYYSDSQFPPILMRDSDDKYLLKPMNCPHHIKIYASEARSYRDLPLRLAEFGTVYRFEQSGELNGLTRVRGFTQDDAHIFCTPDQVKGEFKDTVELVQFVFETFGFKDVMIRLSLRDPNSDKYVGKIEDWNRAEKELREVLTDMKIPYEEAEGEAAFYGPKVDFVVQDVLGRKWQLGTVQLDYNLPERFEIEYAGADSKPHRPVMIHRAPFGSMERFFGILIEHFAGKFPLWLSPEQVRLLPVADRHIAFCEKAAQEMRASGIRVTIDTKSSTISKKVRNAQIDKVNYILVIGDKEEEHNTVNIRTRDEKQLGEKSVQEFIDFLKQEVLHRT
ncbi:MAG: threonine--tRNA ligase [Candidatus Woesearchaeota archaeon]